MSRKLTLGILIALILGHIVLAANYASVTPYRQAGRLLSGGGQDVQDIGAPDERQHVNYIRHLLDAGEFPVFRPGSKDLYETYQSHQPPAFYLIGAAWSKISDAGDLTKRDGGIKLRFLNCLIGGGVVGGVFFLAFWGFQKKELALTAAAFTAFLPMMTALSGAVSNDPLLFLLCTWVMAFLALCLRQGWTWKRVVAIGLLTGLAMLTKTTALGLVPILALAIFLPGDTNLAARKSSDSSAIPSGSEIQDDATSPGAPERSMGHSVGRPRGWLGGAPEPGRGKPSLAMVALAAVLALVLAGPWWARNQKLYQDPFAITAFNQAFKGSPQTANMITMLKEDNPGGSPEFTYWTDYFGWWTARSFFGVFGYMDIFMNEHGTAFTGTSKSGPAPNTLYRLLLAVTALCFIGWVWALTQPEWKPAQPVQILNAAFFLVVLALYVKFNMQYFQAQARYLFPAIGPIACGFAVGASQLLSKRREFVLPAVAGIFLLLNIWAVMQLPDQFAKRVSDSSGASARS